MEFAANLRYTLINKALTRFFPHYPQTKLRSLKTIVYKICKGVWLVTPNTVQGGRGVNLNYISSPKTRSVPNVLTRIVGSCDKQSLQMIRPKPVNLPISNFTAPWIWSVVVKLHKRILPSERDKIMSVFHFLGHLPEGEQVWGRGKWRWDDKAPRSVASNPCLIMKICLARYKMSISQCWYRANQLQAPRYWERGSRKIAWKPRVGWGETE